jgi:EamA domain-containing membrane protein RarD
MKMKKLVAGMVLLTGFTSPAFAHTLSVHEGVAALYHQLLGVHHLPLTALLLVVGIAVFWGWRKKAD